MPTSVNDITDARRSIETWRVHYNTIRPHSSLGFLSPEQSRMAGETGCGKAGRSATLENSTSFPLPHSLNGGISYKILTRGWVLFTLSKRSQSYFPEIAAQIDSWAAFFRPGRAVSGRNGLGARRHHILWPPRLDQRCTSIRNVPRRERVCFGSSGYSGNRFQLKFGTGEGKFFSLCSTACRSRLSPSRNLT